MTSAALIKHGAEIANSDFIFVYSPCTHSKFLKSYTLSYSYHILLAVEKRVCKLLSLGIMT